MRPPVAFEFRSKSLKREIRSFDEDLRAFLNAYPAQI